MQDSIQEKMTEILKAFMSRDERLQASAIVTVDGFIIAYELKTEIEAESLAAMPSAVLSLSKKASRTLMKGNLEQVYLKGNKGYLLMIHSGEELCLTTLATNEAKLGMVFLEMRRAIKDIIDVL
jgi:predicted regulator of Ras-like GTPase activity (Roadblock/LC7/MglB family)